MGQFRCLGNVGVVARDRIDSQVLVKKTEESKARLGGRKLGRNTEILQEVEWWIVQGETEAVDHADAKFSHHKRMSEPGKCVPSALNHGQIIVEAGVGSEAIEGKSVRSELDQLFLIFRQKLHGP